MPLGSARKFTMEPHGYYDTAAEVFEKGPAKEKVPIFTRSKIRCTSVAEWMELADARNGKPIWRVESRFGDRGVYAPEISATAKRRARPPAFITVLRMYREYEKDPTLLLLNREKEPGSFSDSGTSKKLEVYMCSSLGKLAAADLDPEAELNSFMADTSTSRPLMPSVEPLDAAMQLPNPKHDENFYFLNALPGDDVFTLETNKTFTSIMLSALTETGVDAKGKQLTEKRVLAALTRTVTQEKRKAQVDSALDPALILALFAAFDQMLISHDAIDYDVEWPNDYAYTMDRIASCFGPRKPLRKANTYLDEADPPNEYPDKGRGCFDF